MAASGDARVSVGGSTAASTASLTFTDMNWNSPQTVTVTAVHDDDDNDDVTEITLVVNADDSSDEYDNVAISPVAVNIEDDDEAGLIIEPTDLAIEEGVAAVPDGNNYLVPAGYTYTVKLMSEPSAYVDVDVTGHAGTDASLAGVTNDTLTFTPANWNTAQTVTVTEGEDDDDDDEVVTLSHAARSSDSDYNGLTGSDVTVTIEDDEEAGLIFSLNPLELTVDEESSASYTVRLASKPEAAVTVIFSGHANTDVSLAGDVSTNVLNFTPEAWNMPQTVTVMAGPDDDGRNDVFDLNHVPASSDVAYNAVADVTVEITVTDDDEAGLIYCLIPAELTVTEEEPASYTVQLATEPQATVFVLLASDPTTDLTMSGDVVGSRLTFEPDEWDTPQTVTFEVDHDDDGRDGSFDLVHSPASNGDVDYNNFSFTNDPARYIDVTVVDDDSPAVIVEPTGITAVETSSADYTVRLATEPSDEVTVTISGHSGTTASLSGSDVSSDALTFTTDNWTCPRPSLSAPQTIPTPSTTRSPSSTPPPAPATATTTTWLPTPSLAISSRSRSASPTTTALPSPSIPPRSTSTRATPLATPCSSSLDRPRTSPSPSPSQPTPARRC